VTTCELCGGSIEGVPFALSSLRGEASRILAVCAPCAESDYVSLHHCEVELEVWRDDYLPIHEDLADLLAAFEEALVKLEDGGWICERMRLRSKPRRAHDP